MNSIKLRFGVAGTLLLLLFVGGVGWSLEQALRKSLLQSQSDKMRGLVYALLGAAEVTENGEVEVPSLERADPRLAQPESSLSAALIGSQNEVLWGSPSLDHTPILHPHSSPVGTWTFDETHSNGHVIFVSSYGVRWKGERKKPDTLFTVNVAESGGAFQSQILTFRKKLWAGLLVSATILLIFQMIVLRWGLSPLRRFALELRQIQAGAASEISGAVPQELAPLSESLNALLRHERSQQKRFQHALGDLAHSLKTPLAVLKGMLGRDLSEPAFRPDLEEQIGTINRIVGYQLRKAATVGRQAFAAPVVPRKITIQLVDAMKKVHANKAIQFDVQMSESDAIPIDEGDLMELLGNLLDNACKWCRSTVRVTGELRSSEYHVQVEDDGAGFPANPEALLNRGIRADSRKEGQGIGLSVVREMVTVYEGSVRLEKSSLGGAKVDITLPIA